MKTRLLKGLSALLCAALMLSFSPPVTALTTSEILRFDKAPTIDGVLAKDEWGAPDIFVPDYDTSTIPGDASKEHLSGQVYLGYDDTHLYFALQATYDTHQNTQTGYDLYRQNAVQMQISTDGEQGRNALCFALNSDTGHSLAYNSTSKNTWEISETGKEFYIRREGQVTTYELAIPLSWFSTRATLQQGDTLALSFAIPMHNGYYYEWKGGIVTEKNIGKAAVFTLGDSKDLTTPEVIERFPTLDSQPRTILMGDVDQTQSLTVSDARLVLQHAVDKITLTDESVLAADVNGDQTITVSDARLILQKAVNKIDQFPAGDTITVGGEAAEPLPANTISPFEEQAGTPFADLSEVEENSTQVGQDTKQFGYFALTTELNFNLPFNVACYISDDGSRITALLPSGVDLSAVIPTFTYYGDTVLYNGAPLMSGQSVMNLDEDATLTIKAKDGSEQSVTVHIEKLNTHLPSVALTVEGYEEIASRTEYSTATIYVGGGDKAYCAYATDAPKTLPGIAKGRGNSTWEHPKKSYTLKLDTKTTFLDMSESRDWALVSNYEDKTLLRNHLAEYLSEGVGLDYTPQMRPVDLWYNGVYHGTYNLVEKIEVEKDRVNITKFDPLLPVGEVGYLIEFDSHVNEGPGRYERRPFGPGYYNPVTREVFFQIDIGGKWATIVEPSYKDLTLDHVYYIYNKIKQATDALKSGNYQWISQFIDVRSFSKWYLVEEFMNNTDASMHSSVYMTLDVGGKFTLGPIWDFDRSSGNCDYWNPQEDPDSLYKSGAGWFHLLYQTPEARAILKQEWNKFYHVVQDLDPVIDSMADMIYLSQQYNFERWPILEKRVGAQPESVVTAQTFDSQIKLLKDFCRRRVTAMDNFLKGI